MQIDAYTKVVLTVIAIGVGLLVFDQKLVKDAQAANAAQAGGNYMISTTGNSGLWQMSYASIRYCVTYHTSPPSHKCTSWQK